MNYREKLVLIALITFATNIPIAIILFTHGLIAAGYIVITGGTIIIYTALILLDQGDK